MIVASIDQTVLINRLIGTFVQRMILLDTQESLHYELDEQSMRYLVITFNMPVQLSSGAKCLNVGLSLDIYLRPHFRSLISKGSAETAYAQSRQSLRWCD